MVKIYFLLWFILLVPESVFSQNTVGTILNSSDAFEGYTLFTVSKSTYLINNCGQVINEWESDYLTGKSVYILPNGNLLRGEEIQNEDVPFPGIGGRLTIRNWDNELLWTYKFSSPTITSHHDVFPLPNGNILVQIAEKLTNETAIEAGRDPSTLVDGPLYDEKIIEIKPIGTDDIEIVWEWSFWDHLIQDFDETKENYGDVAANPQLLDINFIGFSNSKMNWLHVNSIQYNEALDQIIISSRQLNEFYIIDHSTSTEESSSNSGGIRGKGGNFLYRWGNPQAYRAGEPDDQKLFGQHYPHWIPEGYPDAGKIIVFNNGFNRSSEFSSVDIVDPAQNPDGSYTVPVGKKFGPEEFDWSYTDPNDPLNFYSRILSSAQRLSNGNTLVCEGTKGKFFELDPSNNIVWTYISPLGNNGPLSQGDPPAVKSIFRAEKYPVDYEGFNGRDLSPGNPIELNFNLGNCSVLSVDEDILSNELLFENPVQGRLEIRTVQNILKLEIFDLQGRQILVNYGSNSMDLSEISSGIYFLKIYTELGVISRKIIKS